MRRLAVKLSNERMIADQVNDLVQAILRFIRPKKKPELDFKRSFSYLQVEASLNYKRNCIFSSLNAVSQVFFWRELLLSIEFVSSLPA